MKVLGLAAALAVSAILAVVALSGIGQNRAAPVRDGAAIERPLIFVPGLLGSMLCRPGPDGTQTVVWGTAEAIGQFPTLALEPGSDTIEPCGLIREISFLGVFSQTVYGPFVDRLLAAGYREGETLFVFDYDWRLSVFDNARRLAAFIDETLPGDSKVDIVAHSMGGLVARTYALAEGGAPRIARMVSAGSPWRGSVQVFELLQNGWGVSNFLLGGIENFRRTVLSFASLFDLMPSYDGCCATPATFNAANAAAWTGLNWTGIDADGLPDLGRGLARQQQLLDILAQPLPAGIDEALVIGVDQRTPQQFDLEAGQGAARLEVVTSWDGDGTVPGDSARLPQRIVFPTSFATHDAILNDARVQDFVLATLAGGPNAAIAAVPVQKRGSILTAVGDVVELIGAAVVADQPIYATGARATVTVHLRMPVEDAVDASTLRLAAALPGRSPQPLALSPAPWASDPAVPLEQSFSANLDIGDAPGELQLTLSIATPSGEARTVTRVVPILRR